MKTLLLILLCTTAALARVGGGQDYSGPSSSSRGGGGGGGGGDGGAVFFLIEILFRLIFAFPLIGIPTAIFIAFMVWRWSQSNGGFQSLMEAVDQSGTRAYQQPRPEQPRRAPRPASLLSLTSQDPNFSRPLFLDFLNLLYTQMRLLGGADVSLIGAYLSSSVRQQIEKQPHCLRAIVGAVRIISVDITPENQRVVVEIEANLDMEGGEALLVADQVTLQRRPGARTPAPERVYKFSCPHCGDTAPVDASGRCPSCQNQVNNGRFGWLVTDLYRRVSTAKPPLSLSSGGVEKGTDLPTLVDPNLGSVLGQIEGADPGFSFEALQSYAAETFVNLQKAWTAQEWSLARPLESDQLFGDHTLWMEAYAKEGLRNVLDEVEVLRVQPAAAERDAYFESVTLRMFAQMKDYTVRLADNSLVSGDPRTLRKFSEYWTFIRRAGTTSNSRETTTCPNCAAPLDRVNMAGVCEYCNANITRGDFDWVLSRIEQDESYSP